MAGKCIMSMYSSFRAVKPFVRVLACSVRQVGVFRRTLYRSAGAIHDRPVDRGICLHVPRRAQWGRAGAAQVEDEKTTGETVEEKGLKQRFIYVRTSVGRWEDVPNGIVFDVAYLDSQPGEEFHYACPTVLALHSCPGSTSDLIPVLRPLVSLGYRVLVPAFPGFGETEGLDTGSNDVFMHSTDEKAEFIRDFLLALGIKRVDCLVSVGAGSYPALRLCTTPELMSMFPALVLLCPWPISKFKAMDPEWYHSCVAYLWDRPFFRPFTRLLVKAGRQPLGLEHASIESAITTAYTLSSINFNEVGGHAMAVEAMSVAPVLVLAEDDSFLDDSLTHQLTDALYPQPPTTLRIHADGTTSGGSTSQDLPSCLVFEKGGSDRQLLSTHSKTIASLLVSFVQRIRKMR